MGLIFIIYYYIGLVLTLITGILSFVIAIIQKRNGLKWFLYSLFLPFVLIVIFFILNIRFYIGYLEAHQTDVTLSVGLFVNYLPLLYNIFIIILLIVQNKANLKKQIVQYLILDLISIIAYLVIPIKQKDIILLLIILLSFIWVVLLITTIFKRIIHRN